MTVARNSRGALRLMAASAEPPDDGRTHEHRGLKGRTRGRPSRDPRACRPTRRVPIPPELVDLLCAHLEQFGTGQDGRLFRSENGNPRAAGDAAAAPPL